jgi:hypothetical protein
MALLDVGYWGQFLRRRRIQLFINLVDQVLTRQAVCRILDLGGVPNYWKLMSDLLGSRRYQITIVNRSEFPVPSEYFTSIIGDARHLPSLPDMSFDLVHSNSVIEHVGRWSDMKAMAGEVRRLAPGYFLQTPYFWFPMEPHCSTLFFHWMPESIRVRMLMGRHRGAWGKAPDLDTAMNQIQSAALLDMRMMRTLFPDATIHRERIIGLTKSLTAIRRPDPEIQSLDPKPHDL